MVDSRPGNLIVRPICAKLLRDTQTFGKMNPYCVVTMQSQKQRTRVADGAGKFPNWSESFVFRRTHQDTINFQVWDKNGASSDDIIGEGTKPLHDILSKIAPWEDWVDLKYKGRNEGQIRVNITWAPDGGNEEKKKQDHAVSHQGGPPQAGYPPQPGYPPVPYAPQPGYAQAAYPPQPGYPQAAYPPQPGYPQAAYTPREQYPQDPRIQAPNAPPNQYPQDPRSQYPNNPRNQSSRGQYPQDPRAQYPQDPRIQAPNAPPNQYPQDPRSQYPQDPRSQYPNNPRNQSQRGQYPQDPRAQYPQDPRIQAPNAPPNQYPQDPRSQYSQDPRSQYPNNPRNQSPRGQYPQDPRAQYPQDPRSRYPNAPPNQYPKDPRSQYPQDPRSQSPRGQYPQDPRVQYPQDPRSQYPNNPRNQNPGFGNSPQQFPGQSPQRAPYPHQQGYPQNQPLQSNPAQSELQMPQGPPPIRQLPPITPSQYQQAQNKLSEPRYNNIFPSIQITLSKQNIDFQNIFAQYDSQNLGAVMEKDFIQIVGYKMKLIEYMVLSKQELPVLGKIFDYHNNGWVYYKDFVMKIRNPTAKLGTGDTKRQVDPIWKQKQYRQMARQCQQKKIDVENLFKKYDKNNEQKIQIRDFRAVLNQVFQGMTLQSANMLADQFDNHHDGIIQYRNFINQLIDYTERHKTYQIVLERLIKHCEDNFINFQEQLLVFDQRNTKKLTKDNLISLFSKIGFNLNNLERERFIGQFNIDRDGLYDLRNLCQRIPRPKNDPRNQQSRVQFSPGQPPSNPRSQYPSDPRSLPPQDPRTQYPGNLPNQPLGEQYPNAPRNQPLSDPRGPDPIDPRSQYPNDPRSQRPFSPRHQGYQTSPGIQHLNEPRSQYPNDPRAVNSGAHPPSGIPQPSGYPNQPHLEPQISQPSLGNQPPRVTH